MPSYHVRTVCGFVYAHINHYLQAIYCTAALLVSVDVLLGGKARIQRSEHVLKTMILPRIASTSCSVLALTLAWADNRTTGAPTRMATPRTYMRL
jgi:hypothetical protein